MTMKKIQTLLKEPSKEVINANTITPFAKVRIETTLYLSFEQGGWTRFHCACKAAKTANSDFPRSFVGKLFCSLEKAIDCVSGIEVKRFIILRLLESLLYYDFY
jgi:hypothetical protein